MKLKAQKKNLEQELIRARSNIQYRATNQKIDRYKQDIDTHETTLLEILLHKDEKIKERNEARKLQHDFNRQYEEEEQEVRNILEVLNTDELHEKENLQKLEREFPEEDEWILHFKNLINKSRYDAVVDVSRGNCPGCNLDVCTSLLQDALALEKIVTCEHCDRIIFTTFGEIPLYVSDADIKQGRLSMPPQFALQPKQIMRIQDVWGDWHEAKVAGDWLLGLRKLFDAHALSPGEQVKLLKVGGDENAIRFEPEMVTSQELSRIVNHIESSDQPLNLDSIVTELLSKKARVYRSHLLSSKVRSDLENSEGMYFRGNLVWHRPLSELPKPGLIPPPEVSSTKTLPFSSELPSETTITLNEEAIKIGAFSLSVGFRSHFSDVKSGDKVTLHFGVSETLEVELDAITQSLKGESLRRWYELNCLEPGDRVTLTARNGEQKIFHIHTEWKHDLNRLLEQTRNGTLSCSDRPRDLLYGLLAEAKQALHYRDLWSRAAELSNLRIGTVISTLSRYNRRLFCCIGGGSWGLIEWPVEKLKKEIQEKHDTSEITQLSLSDEQSIWKAVIGIESHDLVYKLLKRAGSDLSYPNIARQLAEMLDVNAQHLIDSSFLNVQDKRFQRLANGNWTLKEFIKTPIPQVKPVMSPQPETNVEQEEHVTHSHRTRWLWYVLATLIAAIVFILVLLTK